jgi:Plasmid encoded RepA protein
MTDRANDNPKDPAQMSLGGIVTNLPAVRAAKRVNTLSRVHRRLIEPSELTEQGNELAFQHTVFCQTSLPYRNPGEEVRLWQRRQGTILLEMQAGRVANPATRDLMEVGLPWGAKPRLILAHLNTKALQKQSPVIEIESSLSAFVKRIRRFDGGREIRFFKDQLTRLSAARITLALFQSDTTAKQIDTKIIEGFDIWLTKDNRQRVLWPTTIQFSQPYFDSLQQHAVPLNEIDLAALAHSALAIDLYCWLAQRLHRVTPTKPAFITWAALKQQFGPDYVRMNKFKEKFRVALRQVQARYDRATLDLDDRGITLHHSLPPVTKQQVMLSPLKSSACS